MTEQIDITQLTIGETRYLEQAIGRPLQSLGDIAEARDASFLPMVTALGVILLKRQGNPKATVEDADQLTLQEVMAAFGMADDPATPAAVEAVEAGDSPE